MSNVSALIPCSDLKRHHEDWVTAIRTLLALPRGNGQMPYLNKSYSALVWKHPKEVAQTPGAWILVSIPKNLFPEVEGETVCAA